MECRQSGLTDHQWCVEHDIKPGTFYNWVKRLCQKVVWIYRHQPDAAIALRKVRKVVRVDFHDTGMLSYEQPLDMLPTSGGKKQHFCNRANEIVCWKFSSNYPKWNGSTAFGSDPSYYEGAEMLGDITAADEIYIVTGL